MKKFEMQLVLSMEDADYYADTPKAAIWDEMYSSDYTQYQLIDLATKQIILYGDNIHDDICSYMEHFLQGVCYASAEDVAVLHSILYPDGTTAFIDLEGELV